MRSAMPWFIGGVIALFAFSILGSSFLGLLGTAAAALFGTMLLFGKGSNNTDAQEFGGREYMAQRHGRHRSPYEQYAELPPPMATPAMPPTQQERTF